MGSIADLEKRMAMGATGALADSWYQPGSSFYGGGGGMKTKSGSSVSEMNAMQLAVVWCCIKVLSEDTASLPTAPIPPQWEGKGQGHRPAAI